MALQYFSENRLDDLRHLYFEDKLFRTFSPVLCELQEQRNELDPVVLWHEVDALRERLRASNYPENEVPFLVNHLRGHLSRQMTEKNEIIERSESETIQSMLCILLLLFFQLSDGAADADKLENNPNHVVCLQLAHILTNPKHDWYIKPMFHNLTYRKTDLMGNKIVLPVVNYMEMKVSLDAMDAIAKQKYERIINHIGELSVRLETYFKINMEEYMEIWKAICTDSDLFMLMGNKNPRTYDKDFNMKMFCNVLGLLQHTKLLTGEDALLPNVQIINNVLGDKNYRNYITYYNATDSNSAYDSNQLAKIERIIESVLKPESEQ